MKRKRIIDKDQMIEDALSAVTPQKRISKEYHLGFSRVQEVSRALKIGLRGVPVQPSLFPRTSPRPPISSLVHREYELMHFAPAKNIRHKPILQTGVMDLVGLMPLEKTDEEFRGNLERIHKLLGDEKDHETVDKLDLNMIGEKYDSDHLKSKRVIRSQTSNMAL